MAEQMFMFRTTAGFMIGLGVLLFMVQDRRSKVQRLLFQIMRTRNQENYDYDSDGKPAYK